MFKCFISNEINHVEKKKITRIKRIRKREIMPFVAYKFRMIMRFVIKLRKLFGSL